MRVELSAVTMGTKGPFTTFAGLQNFLLCDVSTRRMIRSAAYATQHSEKLTPPGHQFEPEEVAALRRTAPGDNPIMRLNVRLKAASDS